MDKKLWIAWSTSEIRQGGINLVAVDVKLAVGNKDAVIGEMYSQVREVNPSAKITVDVKPVTVFNFLEVIGEVGLGESEWNVILNIYKEQQG